MDGMGRIPTLSIYVEDRFILDLFKAIVLRILPW